MMLFVLTSKVFLFAGGLLVVLGLPLLLAKKHPFFVDGWLVWAVGYLALGTPPLMGVWRSPLFGFEFLWKILNVPNSAGYLTSPGAFFLCVVCLAMSVLTLVLPILTWRLVLQKWREKKQSPQQANN